MKNLFSLFGIILVSVLCLTGCENNIDISNNNNNSTNNSTMETTNTKGNCTAIECIKQIEITYAVDEINNIIGFEGELIDETHNIYYWELSEDSGIEVSYYSGAKGTIKVDIDRNLLANGNVDFSKYNALEEKVREGITYDEFKSYIGNVEGTLIEKNSITNKYVWVATDGSYVNGSFSINSGKCTFITGQIK